MAHLDYRVMAGRIYVDDHLTYTKYISCEPHGFREEFFLSLPLYKSMGANDPRDVTNYDPRGMVAGFM